ncbi:MAG: LptF/LptG family permease [Verrucomicrobiales bacterium]|nr:LptF/LptG family permease [Verrucomicrobiales bacterium]
MKTLHGYLLRQVLAALLLTVATATFVLVLGNVLKEVLELMVNRQATLGVVFQALVLLVPFVAVYALPVGMLTATLLVFGRFSADQELTAARASGVSLLSMVSPILLLSVVLCGISAWFNLEIAPRGRMAYKNLLYRFGVEQPTALLTPNTFIRSFKGFIIYVGEAESNRLENLVIYQMDTNVADTITAPDGRGRSAGRLFAIHNARTATVKVDPERRLLTLHMPVVRSLLVDSMSPGEYNDAELEFSLGAGPSSHATPKISEMTVRQLLAEYRRNQAEGVPAYPVVFQLHKQAAFSLACLGFTLVGIPLGIRAHRRETSIGILFAVILMLVYYVFYILAEAWEDLPARQPHLIVWIPNLLFQIVGICLLWRSNRRG